MSVNEEKNPPQAPIRNKKRTRRNVLLLLTFIFILAGLAYTAYWFMVLRHHETTDNAYDADHFAILPIQFHVKQYSLLIDDH